MSTEPIQVSTAAAATTPVTTAQPPTFLGLRFDERRRIVTRDGYDGVKTSLLDRPQLWELLLELVAAGDAPLERGELAAGCRKRAWKGREANDENVLRSALHCPAFTIEAPGHRPAFRARCRRLA